MAASANLADWHTHLLQCSVAADRRGGLGVAQAGEVRSVRWINPAYSYLCSNDPRAHFGLGTAQRVDNIQVIWPDGTEETFPGRAADQLVLLRKGEGNAQGK